MVLLENIKKSFSGKLIFEIPSLTLEKGFTCLFGASGCGKTTLGRIIAGLTKADSGKIQGVSGASTVLFQESRLLPSVSAYDNIKKICRTSEGKALAHELLSTLLFTEDDMKKTGLIRDFDGEVRLYKNGRATYGGLIQDSAGNYYYINSSLVAVRNCSYTISKTNGLLPEGTYNFDRDGKMIGSPSPQPEQ